MRGRVLALVLGLLVVSSAIVFGATTFALRHYLLARLDQQVSAARMTYAQSLEHPDHDSDDVDGFDTEGQSPGTIGARVLANGVVSAGVVRGNARPVALSKTDATAVAQLRVSGSPQTVHLPGLGEYRVSVRHGDEGDRLVAGLPTKGVDDTVHDLAFIELVVFAAVLLATLLIGRRLVRVSLRPLSDLTHTAREVSDLPLDEGDVALHTRVPDPAPGTEIGEVAEAFNHMLDHVAGALNARHRSENQVRQFVADASHELRTPVSVIRSHAEYAQRETADLPDTAARAFDRIRAETARMGSLVDNLLLLARLDAGHPTTWTEVDLTLLVIDAVDGARVTASQHRWTLDLPEESIVVYGDADALHRAVANVISNAVRHTPAGTTIQVGMRSSADQTVEITVGDDGGGIPSDLLPRVFERFMRGDDARSREAGSTGLGLAIVQAIVTAHDGMVTVSSEPGHTEFVLRLPMTD